MQPDTNFTSNILINNYDAIMSKIGGNIHTDRHIALLDIMIKYTNEPETYVNIRGKFDLSIIPHGPTYARYEKIAQNIANYICPCGKLCYHSCTGCSKIKYCNLVCAKNDRPNHIRLCCAYDIYFNGTITNRNKVTANGTDYSDRVECHPKLYEYFGARPLCKINYLENNTIDLNLLANTIHLYKLLRSIDPRVAKNKKLQSRYDAVMHYSEGLLRFASDCDEYENLCQKLYSKVQDLKDRKFGYQYFTNIDQYICPENLHLQLDDKFCSECRCAIAREIFDQYPVLKKRGINFEIN